MSGERGERQLEGIQARTEQQLAGMQDVGHGGQKVRRVGRRAAFQVDDRNHGLFSRSGSRHEGAKLLVVLGGMTRWSSTNTSASPTPRPRTGGTAPRVPC